MLTFPVYEEAHRRALKRPRLEFRGAGGKRRGGKNTERGDRRRHKQSRKRTRHPARGSTWNQDERDSLERPGARSVRPPGRCGSRRTPSRADLSRRYMRLLSPFFVAKFLNRILNIHPSLLPSFPGLESQRQALEYGVKFAGCTVHFVDENLDAGPIILQATVPVLDGDTETTLSEKILKEEHRIYSQAVNIVLQGKYKIEGRRVLRTS